MKKYVVEYLAASRVWVPVTRTDATTGFRTKPLAFDTRAEADKHVEDMLLVSPGWRGLRVTERDM